MKLLRYIILILTLWNIPSFLLFGFSESIGSLASLLSFVLLLLFYFLNKKNKLAWSFILFAFSFFIISGLTYIDEEKYFYADFIKYLVLIICGGELARSTSAKELFIVLLFGASSILIHALSFADDFGRYSGLFLNPNSAGFICLIGCSLSYAIKDEKLRLFGLFFFTFCGILTFSRTFFLLWLIINFISIFQDIKNAKAMALGIGALILLVSVATILQLNTERFSLIESLINNDFDSQVAVKDSRTETWSQYYIKILDSPFFGNGYSSFSGVGGFTAGVHNTYLRIIGEAGIIPLLIFISIYYTIIVKSLKVFKIDVFYFLIAFSIIALLLTTHNFNDNLYITFISIWLYFNLTDKKEDSYEDSLTLLKT